MITKSVRAVDTKLTHSNAGSRTTRTRAGDRRQAILDSASDWEAIELRRRAHAGVWAARTALVLSVPFAVTAWALEQEHAWFMYMVLPVIAAFFSGVFFGSAICSRHRITDEPLAGRQGALVALMAYVIFALEVAAMSFNPVEAGMNAFMGSLLISGWLVFPVSFLAGILAFRAREGAFRFKQQAGAEA